MMKCWQDDPKRRPTFTDLRNQLKSMETSYKVELLYLSTSQINSSLKYLSLPHLKGRFPANFHDQNSKRSLKKVWSNRFICLSCFRPQRLINMRMYDDKLYGNIEDLVEQTTSETSLSLMEAYTFKSIHFLNFL